MKKTKKYKYYYEYNLISNILKIFASLLLKGNSSYNDLYQI